MRGFRASACGAGCGAWFPRTGCWSHGRGNTKGGRRGLTSVSSNAGIFRAYRLYWRRARGEAGHLRRFFPRQKIGVIPLGLTGEARPDYEGGARGAGLGGGSGAALPFADSSEEGAGFAFGGAGGAGGAGSEGDAACYCGRWGCGSPRRASWLLLEEPDAVAAGGLDRAGVGGGPVEIFSGGGSVLPAIVFGEFWAGGVGGLPGGDAGFDDGYDALGGEFGRRARVYCESDG